MNPTPMLGFFRRTFLPHNPIGHAFMTSAGEGKYRRLTRSITDRDIRDHLLGKRTLACVYHRDKRGYIAAADIDEGGMPRLVELLKTVESRGFWAFAIACRGEKHDGGHIFIPFSEEQDATALRALAGDLTGAKEIYPSDGDLRLPFGMNQRTLKRGYLLLQDGTAIDLDTDLVNGIALLESSWTPNAGRLNSPNMGGNLASSSPASDVITDSGRGLSSSRVLVSEILATYDLASRLESYGAIRGAGDLYRCPFHDDHDPSLVIYVDKHGVAACHCYSKQSACPLAEHRHNDVINVVAIGERCTVGDATRLLAAELRASRPMPATGVRSAPAAGQLQQSASSSSRPATTRTQSQSAQRVPATTQNDDSSIRAARQSALLRVLQDATLIPSAKLVYQVLDEAARERGYCSPAVATIAARAPVEPRTVKRALRCLESAGYIVTGFRYGLTSRYTLTWRADAGFDHGVIAESPNMLVDQDHACEGGGAGHESHDSSPADFSGQSCAAAPAIASKRKQDQVASAGQLDQVADQVASAGQLDQVADADCSSSVEEKRPFFWTPAKLQSFSRMRSGPPRPRPGPPRRSAPQQRFTNMAGELKPAIARSPAGQLPAPAPACASAGQLSAPAPAPAERRRVGRLKSPPPSQASQYNPWAVDADDPWIRQQRLALQAAEERGDVERARYLRDLLASVRQLDNRAESMSCV